MTKREKLFFIIVAMVIFLTFASMYVYQHFLEFNNDEVDKRLARQADIYADKKSAFSVLRDSVNSILSSRYLTRQVKTMAKATGLSKEAVLADAAVAHSQSQKYLA